MAPRLGWRKEQARLIVDYKELTENCATRCPNNLRTGSTIEVTSFASRECIYIQHRMFDCGSCHIGKINRNATSAVNMQRALWLQNGTTTVLWCAPKFSLTYLLNARPRPGVAIRPMHSLRCPDRCLWEAEV
jgi:hypothetical protein